MLDPLTRARRGKDTGKHGICDGGMTSAARIAVEKDKEKWEITCTKDTKVTGELKKGSKVTIQCFMTATSVENNPKAPAKK
jgi:hypothetical protein